MSTPPRICITPIVDFDLQQSESEFWMFIVKMFSNDISPIFFVDNIDTSAAELQENLLWIKWTFQWKMRFNLDPNIKTKKVTFSRVIY